MMKGKEGQYLTIISCFSSAYVEILGTREVWRARNRRKSCSKHSLEQLASPLSDLQTSQVLNISTCALLKHELTVLFSISSILSLSFYDSRISSNIIKATISAVNFIIHSKYFPNSDWLKAHT